MISFYTDNFNISQKFYSDSILSLDFNRIECSCHSVNCLSIHAYYYRFVKTPVGKIPIRILRLRCSHCGRTHALISASFIPYTQRSFIDTIKVFLHVQNHEFFFMDFFHHIPSISPADIPHLKFVFARWCSLFHNHEIMFSNPPNLISAHCLFYFHCNFSQLRFRSTDIFYLPHSFSTCLI